MPYKTWRNDYLLPFIEMSNGPSGQIGGLRYGKGGDDKTVREW